MPLSLRISRHSLVVALLLGPVLMLGPGCGGSRISGDHVGTLNWKLRITPDPLPPLVTGQSMTLQARTPWGGQALWSVIPASAGTITPDGLFTAGANPGTGTVFAAWAQDVRYTASTSLTILEPPPPMVTSPDMVLALGAQQTAIGSSLTNGAVAGEGVLAQVATSQDGTIQVRHGFLPPVPSPSN